MSAQSAVSGTCSPLSSSQSASRRRARSVSLLFTGAFAVALCAGSAFAKDAGDNGNNGDNGDNGDNGGAVRLLTTIPVPGTALRAFDISWVDASTQRYYLADRSN